MRTNEANDIATTANEAAQGVEAAVSEGQRGDVPFSVGLLLDASQKELRSLEAMEQSLDSIREAIDQRRRAIDQQEELLRDLASVMR